MHKIRLAIIHNIYHLDCGAKRVIEGMTNSLVSLYESILEKR